jgi:RNA polymerase sigma-70 factor (ECF subfamily)
MESTSASLIYRVGQMGDENAWKRFVELYTPLLHRWCSSLGLSDADASDFTQEAMVSVIRSLPGFRYDPSKSFRAWLKTILLNSWRKHLRKLSRDPVRPGDPDLHAGSDPGVILEDAEYREHLLRKALAIAERDFEPLTWRACWLCAMGERPTEEIAKELGMTVNAVYLAKSRVLRHLRNELRGLLD